MAPSRRRKSSTLFINLIGERRPRRALNDNKAILCALMAGIASLGQLVVTTDERLIVFGFYRFFQRDNSFGDNTSNHVAYRQIIERWHEILYVAHHLLDFTELIFGERPIAGLGRKP